MKFCTSIHCMDGRIQEPIRAFLQKSYDATYVDAITEPGPCKILADGNDQAAIQSILQRVEISLHHHGSGLIAVSGHHDCAGNPCDEWDQKTQIRESVACLRDRYRDTEIIGLWIDDQWNVNPV